MNNDPNIINELFFKEFSGGVLTFIGHIGLKLGNEVCFGVVVVERFMIESFHKVAPYFLDDSVQARSHVPTLIQ